MWSHVFLLILGILFVTTANGWQKGKKYKYEIRGRTVTGLHQVSNQFSGILVKGALAIQLKTENVLSLQVTDFQFANVHANLSNGWSTFIPADELSFGKLPLSDSPFEFKMKNGTIETMFVEKDLSRWEVNMLKGIASLLQIDIRAINLKKSRSNQIPNQQQPLGFYKTMEESVAGKCETLYDVSAFPEYTVASKPELVPKPHLNENGMFITIGKTQNFSNCDQPAVYHFGIPSSTNWEPGSNHMGTFLSRSSISRIILTGTLDEYTVQSSVSLNKIIVAPHLYNKEKGIVASRINITLESVVSAEGPPHSVTNPRILNSLVYEFHPGQDKQGYVSDAKLGDDKFHSNSDSSSSSSSSEENQITNQKETDITSRSRRSSNTQLHNSQENKTETYDSRINSSESNSSSNSSESVEKDGKIKEYQSKSESSHSSSSSSQESSSSSCSSSKENLQLIPSLNTPLYTPFLPEFSVQEKTSTLSNQIDRIIFIHKLANEIGSEILNPNGIIGENTLEKFDILATIIRTMNAEQIQQVTGTLYFPYKNASPYSLPDSQNYHTWIALRDAVAQAGTGPAIIVIKDWITTQKVTYEEAVGLVAQLPSSARFPSLEYIEAFYELVTDKEVTQNLFLNANTLLSFTDLVRKAQVSRRSAHNNYPVHSFGRLTLKNTKLVEEKYIPYLEAQLKKAVSQGDSLKIQLYIRALGNIAHPSILRVYEPYLEGKQTVSKFQRIAIVASMDKLAEVYPNVARSVLFKIYKNTGEVSEARAAAVMLLMKTNPPADILARMAHFTENDNNNQVNSAVKSAIMSASRLTMPQSRELAHNAKAVLSMLTRKEYGAQYSKNIFHSYNVAHEYVSYQNDLSYVESEDSVIPSSFTYSLISDLGGFNRESYKLSAMMSSVDSVVDQLFSQFSISDQNQNMRERPNPRLQPVGETWSYEEVKNYLNIENYNLSQAEGNILVTMLGGRLMFPFDNVTIERLPQLAKDYSYSLRTGQNFNATKMYNNLAMKIAFPTVMGIPFIYSFSTPSLATFSGEVRAKTHPDMGSRTNSIPLPKTINVTMDCRMTYSSKKQGRLGFITPFNRRRYAAAFEKNSHISIPLRHDVNLDMENKNMWAKIRPIDLNRSHKLLEYSSVAYTTMQEIFKFRPALNDASTERIHFKPGHNYKGTVGRESTGFAFDYSYDNAKSHVDLNALFNNIRHHDFVSALLYCSQNFPINSNNFTLSYSPEKSTAKDVKLTMEYGADEGFILKKMMEQTDGVHQAPGFEEREKDHSDIHMRRGPVRKVTEEKPDSTYRRFGATAKFNGQSNIQYNFAASYAQSLILGESRTLVSLSKNDTGGSISDNFQANLQISASMGKVPITDFQKALQADPSSHIKVKLIIEENKQPVLKLSVDGKFTKSEDRREYVRNQPEALACEKQMQQGRYNHRSCLNASISANLLDRYDYKINYENIPESLKNVTYGIYDTIRSLLYPNVEENFNPKDAQGQISVKIQFDKEFQSANILLNTPFLTTHFTDIIVCDVVYPFVVVHPSFNMLNRLKNHLFIEQPFCSVEKDRIQTFDGKSYFINLGKCWHTLVHLISKNTRSDTSDSSGEDKFSILVREDGPKKELTSIIGDTVFEVISKAQGSQIATVKVNGTNANFSVNTAAQYKDKTGSIFAIIYEQNSGDIWLDFPQDSIYIIYSGTHLVVHIDERHRGKVRGLCGTFNGEAADDLTSPINMIIKNPILLAGTYAMANRSCEGNAKNLRERHLINRVPGYRKTTIFGDIISDSDVGHRKSSRMVKNINDLKKSSNLKSATTAGCASHRVLIVHRVGKTCFSLRPQYACNSHCKAKSKIEKNVDFHCIDDSTAASRWVKMVKKGGNPDFSQKGSNYSKLVILPENCEYK